MPRCSGRRLHTAFRRNTCDRPDLVVMRTQTGLQVVARMGSGERPAARRVSPGRPTAGAVWAEAPRAAGVGGPAGWGTPAATAQTAHAAPTAPTAPTAPAPKLRELEQRAMDQALQALQALAGHVSAAARQLGISRNTIDRRRAELAQANNSAAPAGVWRPAEG